MADTSPKPPINSLQKAENPWFIALTFNIPLFIALFIPLRPDHPLVKYALSQTITTSVVFLTFFSMVAIIIGIGIKVCKLHSDTTPFEVRKKGALIIGACLGVLFFAARLFFVS